MSILIFGIENSLMSFVIWLVTSVYKIAAFAFKIFLILAGGELINADEYKLLLENTYVIIGIVMLFVVAFALLKGMVNPDEQKKSTSTIKKMLVNLVTSSIILVLLNPFFTFMFDFQKSVIANENTIGKFFGFGNINSSSSDGAINQVEIGANMIVNSIFTAFFDVSEGYCNEQDKLTVEECRNLIMDDGGYGWDGDLKFSEAVKKVNLDGDFTNYADYAEAVNGGNIEYSFLLSVVAGFILVYIAVSYCFDMALRLVKLVFYQLIAPIPVLLRVIPEGKLGDIFSNWLKITFACYFEVYVRIFILYFCIFLCLKITDGPLFNSNLVNSGFLTIAFTKAFVFMGLMTFMRQAPQLISKLFPALDTGNMKLGIREKLAAGGGFAAGAVLGGGVTALTRNAINSGKNAKNKWQATKGLTGKDKAKAIGSALWATTGGVIGSSLAGGISGAARSGKAGVGAKSWKDMKSSATSGAKAAVDAKDKRASYKARHGGKLIGLEKDAQGKTHLTGSVWGHVSDVGYDIGRWAGFGNVDSLLAENKLIDEISSQRKAIDSESFDVIDGDLAKGKLSVNYDSTNANHLGVTHDMINLRRLKAELDAAKTSGVVADIEKAEVAYSKYRSDWADEIRNISLRGATEWNGLSDGIQADLAGLRMASDKYRETVSRNINAPFMSELADRNDILDKNKSIDVNHSTMKAIKDKMKIEKTQNARKINEARQKEEERKGK